MATKSASNAPRGARRATRSRPQGKGKGNAPRGAGRKEGSSDIAIEQRVWRMYDFILKGYSMRQVVDIVVAMGQARTSTNEKVRAMYQKEMDWGVNERTIAEYYSRAKALIRLDGKVHAGDELGKYVARNDMLFRMAVQDNNIGQARLLEKARIDFFGIDGFEVGAPAPENEKGEVDDSVVFKLPDGTKIKI